VGSGDQGSLSSKAAYPHEDAVLPKALNLQDFTWWV
jgi:hypothetical protein